MREILIITSPFCEDFGISEEVKKELIRKKLNPCAHKTPKISPGEPVSMESYDMLAKAYDAKCDECKKLKAENRKLTAELSKYRYFIECQKNEIEKL